MRRPDCLEGDRNYADRADLSGRMPPPLGAQNLRHGAAKESLDVAGGEPAVAHTHSTPYESEKTIPTIPIYSKAIVSLVGPVDSPRELRHVHA